MRFKKKKKSKDSSEGLSWETSLVVFTPSRVLARVELNTAELPRLPQGSEK